MATLHDRSNAFEAQFAHQEETRFLLTARRDKLFAHWVAARLRLSGDEADGLRKAVLAAAEGPAHDDDLLALVRGRIGRHPHAPSAEELAAGLAACALTAAGQQPAAAVPEGPPR